LRTGAKRGIGPIGLSTAVACSFLDHRSDCPLLVRGGMNSPGLEVRKLDVLDFFDPLAHPGSESLPVTINFPQGIVASRLCARQHAVEPLDAVELDLQRTRCHFVEGQTGLK